MRGLLTLSLALSSAGLTAQPNPATPPSRVYAESPNVWFENYSVRALISPDGRTAKQLSRGGLVHILDLERGTEATDRIWKGVDRVRNAVFNERSELVLNGMSGGKAGWFVDDRTGPTRLPIPDDAFPQWTVDGRNVAFIRTGAPDSIYAGPVGGARAYHIDGRVTGFSWMPDGSSLLVSATSPDGTFHLNRVNVATGRTSVLENDLDASQIAVHPDGKRIYVALASPRKPRPEERHEPVAPRALSIYEVELATGARHVVVPAPAQGEVFAPAIASGNLFWTLAATDASVVVLPAGGGDVRLVASGAQVSSWRPDGRQIGFAYGDWRLADWALNWDGGAIDVDGNGAPLGRVHPVITGYHEDFQPVWSPRGHWVAYHSHRASTPVASYGAPGATDDVWLRPVGVPATYSKEIRLTDYGFEAGSPDWSQDGRRLVFTSWQKGGKFGESFPFLITIDTATGKVLQHGRLPLPKQIHNALWATWSPVSDSLALEEDLGGGRHALWISASDGSGGRKVTEYPMLTYGGVSWTPDGTRLVYAAHTGEPARMQLFDIAVDGGEPHQLTHDAANVFLPSVSPNGELISATRLAHRKEIWRMPLPH